MYTTHNLKVDMAIIRNADGSRVVGIIKQPSKAKNEPTPKVEEIKAEPEVVETAPATPKKSSKKSK